MDDSHPLHLVSAAQKYLLNLQMLAQIVQTALIQWLQCQCSLVQEVAWVVFSVAPQQQQQREHAKRQPGQQWQGLVYRQKAWKRGKVIHMTSHGLTEMTCQADQMLALLVLMRDLQWNQKQNR